MAERWTPRIVGVDARDSFASDFGCTLCISDNGDVYSFGQHTDGAHGHEEEIVFTPKAIFGLKNIVGIACGSHHTICLDFEGVAFSFGSNQFGQLGLNKEYDVLPYTHQPHKIDIPVLITQISSGLQFTVCLSEDGDLYSFGKNDYGQLGINSDIEYSDYPQKLELLKGVDFVECGDSFAVCYTLNNSIFSWGFNFYGQLGTNDNNNQKKPIKTSNWPKKIVDIRCGSWHTLVLTANGEVYSCGSNLFGELGRIISGKTNEEEYSPSVEKIPNLPEIKKIRGGFYSSMCVDIHNNLYVFGNNGYGHLGLQNISTIYSPLKHPSLSDIIDLSIGGRHTFVKTASNEIYGFGDNRCCQLGLETEYYKNQDDPIQVLQDNDIWCSNVFKSRAKSARK